MNKYIELFMRYLVLECACVTSRTGKKWWDLRICAVRICL